MYFPDIFIVIMHQELGVIQDKTEADQLAVTTVRIIIPHPSLATMPTKSKSIVPAGGACPFRQCPIWIQKPSLVTETLLSFPKM